MVDIVSIIIILPASNFLELITLLINLELKFFINSYIVGNLSFRNYARLEKEK